MIELEQKFIGSMLGTFAGDALGMPVEGMTYNEIESYHGILRKMLDGRSKAGTYTDDTQMAIGIAEGLVEKKGVDGEYIANRFVENFEPQRGYGGGTIHALSRIKNGTPWYEAGKGTFGEGSYGNGSAMRIAPIGLFYYDDTEKLWEMARLSSIITHTHPLGIYGAVLQARAISLAVLADLDTGFSAEDFINELIKFLGLKNKGITEGFKQGAEYYTDKLRKMNEMLRHKPGRDEVIQTLGNDVRATHSVPTAIYSFLKNHSSFDEAVIYGVNLGGDTDTIGAMTGAIAGAYHGISGIPKKWLNALEDGEAGRTYVEDLARRLWKVK